jgi:hypothetical protein
MDCKSVRLDCSIIQESKAEEGEEEEEEEEECCSRNHLTTPKSHVYSSASSRSVIDP